MVDYRLDDPKIVEKRVYQGHAGNQCHECGINHSVRDHYDIVVGEPAQTAFHYPNQAVWAGIPRPFAVSNPLLASHTERQASYMWDSSHPERIS